MNASCDITPPTSAGVKAGNRAGEGGRKEEKERETRKETSEKIVDCKRQAASFCVWPSTVNAALSRSPLILSPKSIRGVEEWKSHRRLPESRCSSESSAQETKGAGEAVRR